MTAGGQKLPFAIEVIGFSEEEGVRFGKPFLGSLALVGQLDADILARTDRVGVSVGYAIRQFGLDPDELPAARHRRLGVWVHGVPYRAGAGAGE